MAVNVSLDGHEYNKYLILVCHLVQIKALKVETEIAKRDIK